MAWKDRFTYQSKTFVEHDVNGSKFRFYPNRIGMLHDLAEISRPVAKALSVLFDNQRSDTTAVTERHKFGTDGEIEKITVNATSPEVADHRRKEREQVVDALVDALADGRNRLILGRLLMDSLREEFEFKKERSGAEVEAFLDGDPLTDQPAIDLPILVELIQGWSMANAKVFGKTGEQVASLVRGKLDVLRRNSPSTEETTTDNGSNSKTQSSLQLVTDSPLTSSKA